MENNDSFDIELLVLKEAVEKDPKLLSSLSKEQKDKLILFYTDIIAGQKKEQQNIKEKLKQRK